MTEQQEQPDGGETVPDEENDTVTQPDAVEDDDRETDTEGGEA